MRRYWMLQGFIGALLLVCAPLAHADEGGEPADVPADYVTQDPIGDSFVELFDRHEAEVTPYKYFVLYVLPIDINQDGRLDVMVSANFYRNGQQGPMWTTYFRVDGGYVNLGSELYRKNGPFRGSVPLDFFFESVRVRPNPDTQSTSFFSVGNGGSGSGVLTETRVWNAGMERKFIALLERQDEEDAARIASLGDRFNGLESQVYFMDFGPLQARYAARLHRKPKKKMDESFRNSHHAFYGDRYLRTVDEAYTLLDGKSVGLSDRRADSARQASTFDDADAALAHYLKDDQGNWRPVPVEPLLGRFDEEELAARLYARLEHTEGNEQSAVASTLAALAANSTDPAVRQRFVERALSAGWGGYDYTTTWALIRPFKNRDFNDASKAHVLRALEASKTETHPYVIGRGMARWVGLLGLDEAIPTLREINAVQREIDRRSWNPLFQRTALVALGRMGDTEAVREIIECIEEMDTPRYRALSLQRLAPLRTPETVAYLKGYLFSDLEYDDMGANWLPVSEAQCAADTLAAILTGFPEGNMKAQRQWMAEQTELSFRPAGSEGAFPGLR